MAKTQADKQITFKVTPDFEQALAELAKKRGMTVGPFARELVQQALRQSLTGSHLDEFRELVGNLHTEVNRLKDATPSPLQGGGLPEEFRRLPSEVARLIERLETRVLDGKELADDLKDLRSQIAKMMGTLYMSRNSGASKEEAVEFAKKVIKRKR